LHDWESGLREIDGAEKMDAQHFFEILKGHLEKAFISENSRIVDQNIQPSEVIHGGGNDLSCGIPLPHAVTIGNRLTAQCMDLFCHFIAREDPSVRMPGSFTTTLAPRAASSSA
jgi:hypothetical protein